MSKQMSGAQANQIINTLVRQLCGGNRNRLVAMLGAKYFTYELTEKNEVCFKFRFTAKARDNGKGRPNYCQITLTNDDLYTFELIKIGRAPKYKVTTTYKLEGAYADMLKNLFQDETGLALTLGW